MRGTTDWEMFWLECGPVLERKFGRDGDRSGKAARGCRKSTELWVRSPGCNAHPVTLVSNLSLGLVICHFLQTPFVKSTPATQIYDSTWEEEKKKKKKRMMWANSLLFPRAVSALIHSRKQEIAGMSGKGPGPLHAPMTVCWGAQRRNNGNCFIFCRVGTFSSLLFFRGYRSGLKKEERGSPVIW